MMRMRMMAAASAMAVGLLAPAFSAAAPETPSITVTGEGRASATPDLARIHVGVVTEARTAAEAMEKNSAAMRALLQALHRRNIADDDVQTEQLAVQPRYAQAQDASAPRIVGYEAVHQVAVTVRALNSLGGLLDTLVAHGANRVQNIEFALAHPDALRDQARRSAMEQARHSAELYARTAGLVLGAVTSIRENRMTPFQPLTMGVEAMRASVPVAPGRLEISASVTVVYSARARAAGR